MAQAKSVILLKQIAVSGYNISMKKTYILPLAAIFLFAACTTTKNIQPVSKYEGQSAEQILSQMTLEEKGGQIFVIQPDQLDPAFGRRGFKYHKSFSGILAKNQKKYQVGGIVLFGGNLKDKNQLKKFNSTAQSLSNIPLLIAADEEGGRVTRLAKKEAFGLKNLPSMEAIGNTGDVNQAFDAGIYIGSYLNEYGINWDFAPVTDVNTNPENIIYDINNISNISNISSTNNININIHDETSILNEININNTAFASNTNMLRNLNTENETHCINDINITYLTYITYPTSPTYESYSAYITYLLHS